jgi:hypothetical protein
MAKAGIRSYVVSAAWWQRVLLLGLCWFLAGSLMRLTPLLGSLALLLGLAAAVWLIIGGIRKWPDATGTMKFRPVTLILSLALGGLVFFVSLPLGIAVGEAVKPLSAEELADRQARLAEQTAQDAADEQARADAEASAKASESAAAAAEASASASAQAAADASASAQASADASASAQAAAVERKRLAGCAKLQGGECLIEGTLQINEAYDKDAPIGGHFVCISFDATFVNHSDRDIETFTGSFVPIVTVTDPPEGAKSGDYVLAVSKGRYAGFPYFLARYDYFGMGVGETKEYADDQCATFGSPEIDGTALANLGGLKDIDPNNTVRAKMRFLLEEVQFADGTTETFDDEWVFSAKNTSELVEAWRSNFGGD